VTEASVRLHVLAAAYTLTGNLSTMR
jgi:hypothetical protein